MREKTVPISFFLNEYSKVPNSRGEGIGIKMS